MKRVFLRCILLLGHTANFGWAAEQHNQEPQRQDQQSQVVTPKFLTSRGFVRSKADVNLYVLKSVRLKVAADRLGFPLDAMKPTVSQPAYSDIRTVQVRNLFFIIESEVRDCQNRIIRWSLDKPDAMCSVKVSLAQTRSHDPKFDKRPSAKTEDPQTDLPR